MRCPHCDQQITHIVEDFTPFTDPRGREVAKIKMRAFTCPLCNSILSIETPRRYDT